MTSSKPEQVAIVCDAPKRTRKKSITVRKPATDDAIASRYKPAPRRCLRCHETFQSEWSGHRLCQQCARYAEELG